MASFRISQLLPGLPDAYSGTDGPQHCVGQTLNPPAGRLRLHAHILFAVWPAGRLGTHPQAGCLC
jgi:hypothetical protein